MSGEDPNQKDGLPADEADSTLGEPSGEAAAEGEALDESTALPSGASQPSEDVVETEADLAAAAQASADTDATVAGEPASVTVTEAADGDVFSQTDIDAAFGDASDAGGQVAQSDIDAAIAQAAALVAETASAPKLDSNGRPFDEAAAMMEAAIAEERAAAASTAGAQASQPLPPLPPNAIPLELPQFSGAAGAGEKGIDFLGNVDLDVKIELGRTHMLIEDVLKLGEGSVVELDKLAGDPVDILVNERLVARGEVLVLNDSFCVRVSEIVAGVGAEESSANN